MKTFKGIVASLVLCLFSSSLQAPGIAAELMTFFKSEGMASNVTFPGSYKDQSDGDQLELFPNAQPDNGLFEQWQQGGQGGGQGQVMPALYAVNPNTGHVIPIALGMTSIDQMETRIMSLVGKS